jgi:flavin-dependent dehydrogenase
MARFQKTDVFVIGGGPVGLAAAIAARRKGFSVKLADAQKPPVDKACGEGILPDGVEAAERLGLQLPAASCGLRGIRFQSEDASVTGDFPNGPGRGVRRLSLHRALIEQAEGRGVELHWQTPVAEPRDIDARWIIGADGGESRVRGWIGLNSRMLRDTRRFGFRVHFQVAPWADYVEIHWGDGCQIYVTPVARDEVGVALISRNPKLRVREALHQFPALRARLQGAAESSRERGAVTASRRLRRVTRGSVALIGDAAGSIDAISGEGLCLGFHQALELANALERGNLNLYESAHRRLSARPRFMADLMLTMDRSPWLRARALAALAARPDLFDGLLAMHVGAARRMDFAATCLSLGCATGWKMLTYEDKTSVTGASAIKLRSESTLGKPRRGGGASLIPE